MKYIENFALSYTFPTCMKSIFLSSDNIQLGYLWLFVVITLNFCPCAGIWFRTSQALIRLSWPGWWSMCVARWSTWTNSTLNTYSLMDTFSYCHSHQTQTDPSTHIILWYTCISTLKSLIQCNWTLNNNMMKTNLQL